MILTDNVNLMADNLTGQVRNIAEVTTAVGAWRHCLKKIAVDAKGEDPRIEIHHQYNGGSAQLLLVGSNARSRPGSGLRKAAINQYISN